MVDSDKSGSRNPQIFVMAYILYVTYSCWLVIFSIIKGKLIQDIATMFRLFY